MGGRLVLSGQLTPGQMVSFLLYTVSIAAAFGALATFFSAYQEAVGAAQRVFELLETVSPVADPPRAEPPHGRPLLAGPGPDAAPPRPGAGGR